ncbi:MAG: hypothetical protein ACR2JW_17075 [Thermomicrobiales bacterium]
MIYQLWDEETAFLIDTYSDLSDALVVVAATYRDHGWAAVEEWRLAQSTPSGEHSETIAEGKEFVRLPSATPNQFVRTARTR